MIEKVLIQQVDGQFPTVNHYTAWYGFTKVGMDIEFYSWPDLQNGLVETRPEFLVVGGVVCVREALRRIGALEPPPLDYPEDLDPFLGRRVWRETLSVMRERYNDPGHPLFFKPADHGKEFDGQTISRFRDLVPTARFPGTTPILVSDTVTFVSEFRYFVHRNKVIGVGYYRGDPLLAPDANVVRQAVRAYGDAAPIAYGLDMGVTDKGETLLVEVNDAFALGAYGLSYTKYVNLLEDRWRQLVGLPPL